MNKSMIANQPMTYGTRRLLPGDEFVASRRDADLLARIGRAKLAEVKADPLDHDGNGKKGGSLKPEASEELTALRTQYHDKFGKRPFHGWDAKTLTSKLAEEPKD